MFIDTFRSNFYVNLVAWGLLHYTEWCVIMGSYRCNNACQLNEYIVKGPQSNNLKSLSWNLSWNVVKLLNW